MDQITYNEAVKELEAIVAKMESNTCDIDQLAQYTSRALQLLKFCREKLFKTNEEVERCLEELRNALPEGGI